ncbi:MAG: butyrate kinase [Oscillospiraceae bacterium]|jgi:butyrate kinase|nr:butyrate kinase [Oscillospiraceae bacterium]
MGERILAINPGSTSTKIALFDGADGALHELFSVKAAHTSEELTQFPTIQSQLQFRTRVVEETLTAQGFALSDIDAFVGRGGGLMPLVGGTYAVNALLLDHASRGMNGTHPAQLAAQICDNYAKRYGKRAFVVDPPNTDEFDEVARPTGLRGVYRESSVHALNQKEVARRYCAAHGLRYEDANFVVAHIGGGVSVTAHRRGRMVDSNDTLRGSGPMSPTRAGDLPYIDVIELAYSGEYSKTRLVDRLNRRGGFTDIFGTSDMREIEALAETGDRRAVLYRNAMIHQLAKYAGAMAAVLNGEVDAVILTGGVTRWTDFAERLAARVRWIAEVAVVAGEFEMEALAAGALRVLRGEEKAREYTGEAVWGQLTVNN